jgi:ketosteroid isomerase-like protein
MRIFSRRILTAGLFLLFAVSSPVFSDTASDRTAIEAATQAWTKSFNARDAKSMSALTTEDIVLLDPELSTVRGRDAARQAWEQAFGVAREPVANATKEIVIAGDVAWRIGALTQKTPTGAVTTQCLEIWQRVKGSWKMHRQMTAGLLTPPELLRRPNPSEPVLNTRPN